MNFKIMILKFVFMNVGMCQASLALVIRKAWMVTPNSLKLVHYLLTIVRLYFHGC